MTAMEVQAEALFEEALHHYKQGRYRHAAGRIAQALQLEPGRPQLWDLAGLAAAGANDAVAAVRCWQRAIALAPDYLEARFNLGLLFKQQQRYGQALIAFESIVDRNPEHVPALLNLSRLLLKLDRADDAFQCAERAVAADPNSHEAFHSLGYAAANLGRDELCISSLERAIALAPESHRASEYHTLSLCKTFTPSDASRIFPQMEALLASSSALPSDQLIELHFALGKIHKDVEQYEASFSHYCEGNRLKRLSFPYDEALTLKELGSVRENWTREAISANAGAGADSSRPLFIVGMPRSGSSLVEQILSCVPSVHAAGEMGDVGELIRVLTLPRGPLPSPLEPGAWTPQTLLGLGQEYLRRLQKMNEDALLVINKTLTNFRHLGLIHLALPGARIVHVRRDPIDTCVSCFSLLFEGDFPWAYDLGDLGRYWKAYDQLMTHWRSLLPDSVFIEVRYEELVSDFEAQTRRLLDFCDLPWSQACLEFHSRRRIVHTASFQQVRKPLYRSSVQQWQKYRPHLTQLIKALGLPAIAGHAQCST